MAIQNVLFKHAYRVSGKEIDANFEHLNSLVPYSNVQDFGAKGDGTTDDRPAIQTALNSMTSGGTLFFPRGTYRIGSPGLSIPSNITLLGEPNSILKATDVFPDTFGNSSVLQNYTPPYAAVGNTNISIDTLKIDGNTLATRCILFQGGSRLSVRNCHTLDPTTLGAHIDVRDFDYGIFDNNYIEGNANGLGINCLDGANFIQITNNRIQNTLDSCISIGTGGGNIVSYIIVSGNVLNTTNAYGIDLFGSVEDTIIGHNIIRDCHLAGIQGNVASGTLYPKNFIIIGNIILDGDTSPIGLNADTTSNTQIIGNQMRNNGGNVLVSQSKNLLFTDNIMDGNAGTPSFLLITNKIIRHNFGYVTENSGKAIGISSGGTIAHGLVTTPSSISVTAASTGVTDITTTVDATNITVTFGGGGAKDFFWNAQVS